MLLFNQDKCITICLKNTNPYVRLATEDLRNDFKRVSTHGISPEFVDFECDDCLIIEENVSNSCDPITDESYTIKTEGSKIRISANGYLGTMWGIYTFCEKYLGVNPCYLFNDLETQKQSYLEIPDIDITDKPESFGFRGVFINDEDLLTGWKDDGGLRRIDYSFYQQTVSADVMDMVVETVLRLKMNLIIPASLLDIDNPAEKALADCVARRGIYLSQHHLEPIGVSHFALKNYCEKFQKNGDYSYIQHPQLLEEVWRYYAKKWSEYDNVVWQVGLRGKLDRPMWEEATPTEDELHKYGTFISNAIHKQRQIVLEETNGHAKYFTSTLWMEGSTLMQKGCLNIDENVIFIFSDNGPNQMFGNEYHQIPRSQQLKYGIYYHLQYYDIGPHLTPQTGLHKIYYNMDRAYRMGDRNYFIINLSNVREFTFELGACAKLLWDINSISEEDYLSEYCNLTYGNKASEAQPLIHAYFDLLPQLETAHLRNVYAKYFNYCYDELSPGVKNFILKEGLILNFGKNVIAAFWQPFHDEFYTKVYNELKTAQPKYATLSEAFEKLCSSLDASTALHTRVKWKLHCDTLASIYRWFICLYEAKLCYDANDGKGMRNHIKEACEVLNKYLETRQCAEYGSFKNWYRGDVKMGIRSRLADTRRLLGYG